MCKNQRNSFSRSKSRPWTSCDGQTALDADVRRSFLLCGGKHNSLTVRVFSRSLTHTHTKSQCHHDRRIRIGPTLRHPRRRIWWAIGNNNLRI